MIWLAIFIVVGIVVFAVISWGIVAYIKPDDPTERKDSLMIMAQVFAGSAILGGLFFTWQNLVATEENISIAQEREVRDQFNKSVDQLQSSDSSVRSAAIATLEQIANESEKHHWPIMEALSAYVRQNAPVKEIQSAEENPRLADIRAILAILVRRNVGHETVNQRLDLSRTDLSGANLIDAHLPGVNFSGARLNGALLSGSNLEGGRFDEAHLEMVNLADANLNNASLSKARLDSAILDRAQLNSANMVAAFLGQANALGISADGADLSQADLTNALLSRASLRGAVLVEAILLDANLIRANLAEADMSQAQLDGAALDGAVLRGAFLSRATLDGARMPSADLRGADLRNATGLEKEQIAAAIIDDTTRLPQSISFQFGSETLLGTTWKWVCDPCSSPKVLYIKLRSDGLFGVNYNEPGAFEFDGDETWKVESSRLIIDWNSGFSVESYQITDLDPDVLRGTKSNIPGEVVLERVR